MGLKNSPRSMQRLMDRVLRGASNFAGVLLDDIVIGLYTFDEHEVYLKNILCRLREANLTVSSIKQIRISA